MRFIDISENPGMLSSGDGSLDSTEIVQFISALDKNSSLQELRLPKETISALIQHQLMYREFGGTVRIPSNHTLKVLEPISSAHPIPPLVEIKQTLQRNAMGSAAPREILHSSTENLLGS